MKAYRTPVSKAVVIYNGFNELRYCKKVDEETKKNELGIKTKYIVAMVASFWEAKDWQCYIDTAKKIIKQRHDITFLAIGRGPQWDFYNSQISKEEHTLIQMMGRRNDIDEIYQICNVTVLTSFNGEGVSNSIMESMAWGVPAIATNSGGTPEIIENKVNGELIDNQTPDSVASMITNLIDNSNDLSQMGKKAFQTIKDRFLLQRMTKEYIELYQNIDYENI